MDVQPRLETLPPRSYDAWPAEAQAVGVLTDLELAALREAQLALPELPAQIFLVLGVSPAVEGGGERINDVIFSEMLEGVRTRGIRVAATEAGSGRSASDHLRALRALAPDYVRLDEALTRSVDGSVSNHPLIAEVVACAEQISTRVIAAGVASEGQLEEMRRLGVHLVQGAHVGESFQLSELSNRVAALRSALPPVVT